MRGIDMGNKQTTAAVLRQAALFAALSERELALIASDLVQRRYGPGQTIFNQGDPGQMLYLLATGQVRIFVNGLEGSETSVILCGRPGDIFGELAVIDGLPRSATAIALSDTTVLILSRAAFRRHMRRIPQLSLSFLKLLSTRVRYNTKQVDSLTSLDVAGRLACKLLELGKDYGVVAAAGVRLDMPLTQTDLASLVGATRESVNKMLRVFRKQGLISQEQGQIVLLETDGLRALGAVGYPAGEG
jgi:CRP-like cAMP-binding protein